MDFPETGVGDVSSYCESAPTQPVHQYYHDHEYGFPVDRDDVLFERFALEIFQAGLSWEIVLKKRAETFKAFNRFRVSRVASYGDDDVERLLGNAGIIRNRLKIRAIIHNARVIQSWGKNGFKTWLDANHAMNRGDWTRLFKNTFKFTGGEIVNELLMSTGYLPGAHEETCPIYTKIADLNPPWMQVPPSVFDQ